MTSSIIDTNATSQVKGYLGGSGFQYTRYGGIGNLAHKHFSYLRDYLNAGNSLPIQEQSVRAVLETYDVYDGWYGQVFKGYFYAPVSGDYIFRGAADDSFGVYMSDSYGTAASVNNRPVIYSY